MKSFKNPALATVTGILIGAVIGFVCFRLTTVNAGNLEPTTPPGPTMKTLDQVEPRILIPGSSSPAATFTINTSGSYYLTGDRFCNDTGIKVNVDNVTIDLCGYGLIGWDFPRGSGIWIDGHRNVEIRNGTIRGFGNHGIYGSNSVSGANHRIFSVRAIANSGRGISLDSIGNIIKDCTVSDNAEDGIYANNVSNLTGNIVHNNDANGIYTGSNCTIKDNSVYSNGDSGIYAGPSCLISGNTTPNNGVNGINAGAICSIVNNISNSNGEVAIIAGSGSIVIGNAAYLSYYLCGIYANSGCTVKDNTAYSNSLGIIAETGCAIIGNATRGNEFGGMDCHSSLVDQNSSSGNGGPNISASGCVLGLNWE